MSREAWIVIDLGFGDAGKGTITDYLVRERGAGLVVRFNGGAQAGHNVVTADGRHHTFSQLVAGSFVPGVRGYLGPDFVLHPGALLVEAAALARAGVGDALERTFVDQRALVVSPFQQAAGRLRELARGAERHGTCGVGIGEAVGDAESGVEIRVSDLHRPRLLSDRLGAIRDKKRAELEFARGLSDPRAEEEWSLLDDPGAVARTVELWREAARAINVVSPERARELIDRTEAVVFEGAQGALLDQDFGFHPHTTWSDCTTRGARALIAGMDVALRAIGVTRSYATRHGAGPLPSEDDILRRESHNDDDGWQGAFRTGALDLVLLRSALRIAGGIDGLAVTCLDRVSGDVPVCESYSLDGEQLRHLRLAGDLEHRARLTARIARAECRLAKVPASELPAHLERAVGVPVLITSHGPTAGAKRWR